MPGTVVGVVGFRPTIRNKTGVVPAPSHSLSLGRIEEETIETKSRCGILATYRRQYRSHSPNKHGLAGHTIKAANGWRGGGGFWYLIKHI